jgi:hypothetical protein
VISGKVAAPPDIDYPSVIVLDERKRSKDESLVRGGPSLAESSGEDALQLNQALFGAAREVQSYYGSLIPSKGFKFSEGQGLIGADRKNSRRRESRCP